MVVGRGAAGWMVEVLQVVRALPGARDGGQRVGVADAVKVQRVLAVVVGGLAGGRTVVEQVGHADVIRVLDVAVAVEPCRQTVGAAQIAGAAVVVLVELIVPPQIVLQAHAGVGVAEGELGLPLLPVRVVDGVVDALVTVGAPRGLSVLGDVVVIEADRVVVWVRRGVVHQADHGVVGDEQRDDAVAVRIRVLRGLRAVGEVHLVDVVDVPVRLFCAGCALAVLEHPYLTQ